MIPRRGADRNAVCVQFLIVEVDPGTVKGIFNPVPADQRVDKKATIGGSRIGADKGNLGRRAERNRAGTVITDGVAIGLDVACGLTDMEVPPHDI